MTPRMEQAVQRVIAAMEQAVEAGQPLSIQDMAKVARFSPFHMCRAFRAATGQSPMAYMTGLRYQRAAELLATTDLTLRGVCDPGGVPQRGHVRGPVPPPLRDHAGAVPEPGAGGRCGMSAPTIADPSLCPCGRVRSTPHQCEFRPGTEPQAHAAGMVHPAPVPGCPWCLPVGCPCGDGCVDAAGCWSRWQASETTWRQAAAPALGVGTASYGTGRGRS